MEDVILGRGASVDEAEISVENLVDPFLVGFAGEDLTGMGQKQEIVDTIVKIVESV